MTQLTDIELTKLYELMVLLSQKNTFRIEEYGDVFTVYSKVKKYIVELQNSKETPDALEFSKPEIDFLYTLISASTDRVAINVTMMESVLGLFKRLGEIQVSLTPSTDDVEDKIQELP